MNSDFLIPLLVIVPLFSGFLFTLFRKYTLVVKILSLIFVAGLSIISIFLFNVKKIIAVGGWDAPIGIVFKYDGFSALLISIIALVSLTAIIYSFSYMKRFTSQGKYYGLFFLMIAGMNGVVITGDFFNLFVFLEIASISSYVLVGFGVEKEELEASFKYLVQGSIGSAFIFLGIGILYAAYGSLNMAHIASKIASGSGNIAAKYLSLSFFIMGFSLKAALFPFHAWLPDAHPSAPAPISAMLSGLLVKAVGVYSIVRITYNVFGLSSQMKHIFLILGALSMIIGVLLAIGQWDYKRLCAYHSISQLGYIMLAFGIGTKLAIIGGIFHLLNHSVFKSLLFLNAGAVEYRTGTRNLKKMGGIKDDMPIAGTTSMVGSLSISGIPPFNGFFSKVIIIIAAISAGYYIYGALAVLGSILTLASFLKVQRFAFFGKKVFSDLKDAPFSMSLSMIILAVLCLAMSFFALPAVQDFIFNGAVSALLP